MTAERVTHVKEVWTQGDNTTITCTAVDLDGVTTLGDLSTATVELVYWFEGKAPAKLSGSGTAASVLSAKFSTGIPDHGIMHFIWRVNDGTDEFHSVAEFQVYVRRRPYQAAA